MYPHKTGLLAKPATRTWQAQLETLDNRPPTSGFATILRRSIWSPKESRMGPRQRMPNQWRFARFL